MEIAVIQNRIYEIRGHKVMLDFDLAELYEVETRVLNQAVKRNPDRFPEDFMFRLTESEWAVMRSQIVTASKTGMSSQTVMTSNEIAKNKVGDKVLISQIVTSKKETRGGTQKMPYGFTEHGITILASVLRSKKSIGHECSNCKNFHSHAAHCKRPT